MNTSTRLKPKPTPNLVYTACLSGGYTIVISLIYAALSVVAIVYRFDCDAAPADISKGSNYFLNTVYNAYIRKEECSPVIIEGITGDHSVFVLVAITLSVSLLALVVSILLITAVIAESETQSIHIIAYGYIGVCVAAIVIDVTFAIHFGMDYGHLSNLLNSSSPGMSFHYETDMIRLGAFFLMSFCLKGFIGLAINITLLSLLVQYLMEYAYILAKSEHSIHKLGALKAFDTNQSNGSVQNQAIFPSFSSGPQLNYGFLNDEEPPLSPMRENTSASFDRSYSWQPGHGRPFNYLENPGRPSGGRAPSPLGEQWRRDPWRSPGPPPVPAPDYSPTAPRRLKSALKPYM